MMPSMEPLHISEGELAKDVRSILQRVEAGTEVIIERDAHPVAVIRPAELVRRKISECIALMPADSAATIDSDFANDVEAAIAAHREPLEPPAWGLMLESVAIQIGDDGIALSVVTALELAHGIMRADTTERREKRQRFLDELLTGVPIQPVTIPIALRAGQIDGQSQSKGVRIPLSDLLIGASALELGYEVGTANVRHFQLIPGLNVIRL